MDLIFSLENNLPEYAKIKFKKCLQKNPDLAYFKDGKYEKKNIMPN